MLVEDDGKEEDDTIVVTLKSSNQNKTAANVAPIETGLSVQIPINPMITGSPVQMPLSNILMVRAKSLTMLVKNEVLSELPMADTIFNTKVVNDWVEYVVSDSGAICHYLVEGSPAVNKRRATTPIHITLSNGKSIKSSHNATLAYCGC